MRKLKAITIKGLFGRHNYELNFDEKGGFTMLAAPNGYGKSTILKIIRAIASGNVFFFEDLDFKKIKADYHEEIANSGMPNLLKKQFIQKNGSSSNDFSLTIKKVCKKSTQTNHHYTNELLDFLKSDPRLSSKIDVYTNKNVVIRPEDLEIIHNLQKYHMSKPKLFNSKKYKSYVNDYFTSSDSDFEITFSVLDKPFKITSKDFENCRKKLETDDGNNQTKGISLTEMFYANSLPFKMFIANEISWIPSFIKKTGLDYIYVGANREISGTGIANNSFSSVDELSALIAHVSDVQQKNCAAKSRKLDVNLVNSILENLKNKKNTDVSKATVLEKYSILLASEKMLQNFGINHAEEQELTKFDTKFFEQGNDLPETTLNVLNSVLDCAAQKTEAYLPLTDTFVLFQATLNKLLSFVSVEPSVKGILVKTAKEEGKKQKSLPLSVLSSGEQQLIVLLGIMLFYTPRLDNNNLDGPLIPSVQKDNRILVLIDEPEISMHPAWQEELANFFWKVKEDYQKDFIFATHSPTFIGRRWNNVFELAELADGNKSEE